MGVGNSISFEGKRVFGVFFEVKVLAILPRPFRHVLEDIVNNGKALGIPTGVANGDVICEFEIGN